MRRSPKQPPKPGLERSPLVEEDMSDGQLKQLILDCKTLDAVVDDARGYTRSGVPSKDYLFTQTSAAIALNDANYLWERIHIANQFLLLRTELRAVEPEYHAEITARHMKMITSGRDSAYSSDVTVLNDILTRMGVEQTSYLRPTHSAQFEQNESPNSDSRSPNQKVGKRHGGESDDQTVQDGTDKPWLASTQRTIKAGKTTYSRNTLANVFMKLESITANQRDVAILKYGYVIASDKTIGELLHCSPKSVYDRIKGLKAKLHQPPVVEELRKILAQRGEKDLSESIEKLLRE
jgi:DNA-binding CsgD family transcriptional regulator